MDRRFVFLSLCVLWLACVEAKLSDADEKLLSSIKSKTQFKQSEFDEICRSLFLNEKGKLYSASNTQKYAAQTQAIFNEFATNGVIQDPASVANFKNWVETFVLKPKYAFLIIDMQNDFINGTLTVGGGAQIIEPMNALLTSTKFDMVVYSKDWHPKGHISHFPIDPSRKVIKGKAALFETVTFAGNPNPVEQKLWPPHCVQNQWGAELHKDLKKLPGSSEVLKGEDPNVDSYSAFATNDRKYKTKLDDMLKKNQITNVIVAGLAYDFCVKFSAIDALYYGYGTVLLADCARAVDPNSINQANKDIEKDGGLIANSAMVRDMVDGTYHPMELALYHAKRFKSAKKA